MVVVTGVANMVIVVAVVVIMIVAVVAAAVAVADVTSVPLTITIITPSGRSTWTRTTGRIKGVERSQSSHWR